jgi:hypothetical protein
MHGVLRIAAFAALLALPVRAQNVVRAQSTEAMALPAGAARVPYGVGELLEYDISYYAKFHIGGHVGNGNIEVLPMDTVRGHDVWHTVFRLNGAIPLYSVHDQYEDWSDVKTLASLRYRQNIAEGGYDPKRLFEIYPERREVIEVSKKDAKPEPSVEHPLDEAGFLFYLRTIPLHVGMDTTFNDYFKGGKAMRLRVLRRDTIDTGAGRFAAIVVQPTFDSKLFSEGGHAEVWLSDDENRIMLQMKSNVSFGSLNLYLKSYRPSPTTNVPLNRVPKR